MLHIKFRGKKETITNENEDYLNKGWVYGNSLYQDDGGMYLIPDGVSAERKGKLKADMVEKVVE